MKRMAMPESDIIRLEGEYSPDHLQDVCRGGNFLSWAHTLQLVKTDLDGRVVATTLTGTSSS